MSETKKITYKIKDDQFRIKIAGFFEACIKYPHPFLKSLSQQSRENLLENLIYCRTRALGLYFDKLCYQGKKPLLYNLINQGVRMDLPYSNFNKHIKTSVWLEKIARSRAYFSKKEEGGRVMPKNRLKNQGVLAISFGKDSLLSYALAKEIGLKCRLVFINDMGGYNLGELNEKKKIIANFTKNENEEVFVINDNSDDIYDIRNLKTINENLAGSNAMLAFTLELIPLAYYFKSKYLIFGNEKDLDDFCFDKEGFKVYPSCDQSTNYMRRKNVELSKLTKKTLQTVSLIKPLYNLAEVKILSRRYPKLLNYLMSCDSKKVSGNRTCGHCISCAYTSLYATAFNVDPAKFGLKKPLFELKYKNLYTIFNPQIGKASEKSQLAKEEQMLAFLLAVQNGTSGELIELFKKKFLKETLKKEKELKKKFFGIYSTDLLPTEFKNKILKIFKEELGRNN